MLAGLGEGAAAGAAVFEVGAPLVHLAEFLAHKADDFHAQEGLSPHEFEENGRCDEAEGAVGLAMCAEGVWGGAESRGESYDTPGTQEALENFAAVFSDDRDAGETILNDIDAATLGALADDDVVS